MRASASALAVAAAVLLAVPQTAQAAPPERHRVTGTGYVSAFNSSVTVDATRQGNSGKLRGSFEVTPDDLGSGRPYAVNIECMATDGNRVIVGGPYRPDEGYVDYYGFLIIEDNGKTGDMLGLSYGGTDCGETLGQSTPGARFLVSPGDFTLAGGQGASA